MDFHGRAAAHKLKITMRNAKHWLEWCKTLRHSTLEQWKCVPGSDESASLMLLWLNVIAKQYE